MFYELCDDFWEVGGMSDVVNVTPKREFRIDFMPSEMKIFHSLKSVFKERLETIYLYRVTPFTMTKTDEFVSAVSIDVHSDWGNILSCWIVMALFIWKFYIYLVNCQMILTEYKLILVINFPLFNSLVNFLLWKFFQGW